MTGERLATLAMYGTGLAGIGLVLVVNSREQQIALLSWQNAALLGYAALVALGTGVVVRLLHARGGGL